MSEIKWLRLCVVHFEETRSTARVNFIVRPLYLETDVVRVLFRIQLASECASCDRWCGSNQGVFGRTVVANPLLDHDVPIQNGMPLPA